MKKLALILGILGLVSGAVFAGGTMVQWIGSSGMNSSTDVYVASTTATKILAANSLRKSLKISNNNYVVRISSFATTNNQYGFLISSSSSFNDDMNPYVGDIYAISVNTNAVVSVYEDYQLGY